MGVLGDAGCQNRPLSLGSQGIPSLEPAGVGGNSKSVSGSHVHAGAGGWGLGWPHTVERWAAAAQVF